MARCRLGGRFGRSGGRGEGRADGAAPGVGAEGVDVFVLGEVDRLDQGLAEIGEGGGGLGFDVALSYSGEEAGQGGAEIAGGEIAAREVSGDVAAHLLGGESLRFLACMVIAEMGMAGASRSAALAAISEGERTQRGTVFFMRDRRAVDGAIGGHGSLQKRRV